MLIVVGIITLCDMSLNVSDVIPWLHHENENVIVTPFILIKLDKSHFNKEAFNGGDNNSDGNLPLT